MPPSDKAVHRCLCISGGCNAVVDLQTGQMGRLLTARQLAAHERSDRNRDAADHLAQIQAQALRRNEAEIAASSDSSSSGSTFRIPSPTAQSSRMERERTAIRNIAAIRDQIDDIAQETDSRIPVTEGSSNNQLTQRAEELKPLVERLNSLSTDLAAIIPAVPRGWDSAQRMFSETKGKLDVLSRSFDNEVQFCQNTCHAREILDKLAREARPGYYQTDHYFVPLLAHVHPLLQLVNFMMVVCSALFGLSHRGCAWLLSMTAYIIQIAATYTSPSLSHTLRSVLADFPASPDDIINQFRLEAKSTVLATCTNARCRKTHKPTIVDGVLSYRRRCNGHFYTPKGKYACRRELVRPKTIGGKEFAVPILPFISFDLRDWVASLTARPNLETEMDKVWDTLNGDIPTTKSDIFHGSVARELQGLDGKPFGNGGGEGRYLLTLSVDWFNPLGNRIAGKKISVGGIALVCLNLPIEERYKPENMFLAGIIPGPSEIKVDGCNYFIQPIVDDLLAFWDPGVFFSKTWSYPEGRRVRCALIALVCDILAARKFSAFASHSANKFCSRCECEKQSGGLNDYDPSTWIFRTNEGCRAQGLEFCSAQTSRERDDVVSWYGRRWSELERLPYFDITRYVVVDPMHNLLLGLLEEHFRFILGFEPRHKVQKQAYERRTPAPVVDIDVEKPVLLNKGAVDAWDRLVLWLGAPMNSYLEEEETKEYEDAFKRFSKQNKEALSKLAEALDIPSSGTRKDIVKAIFQWRCTLIERESPEPLEKDYDVVYTSEELGCIFTASEITELLEDIERMVRPSWLTKPPVLSGGKLKADDWRSLCTTTLPMSLIRLWADKTDEHHTVLLEMTLCLVSAVIVACSRSTSQQHADEYAAYMLRYRELLHSKFPDFVAKPNFHFALHIPEFLMMYGPVHGWWTFPFERLWGTLQNVPTNYMPGQYERTMAEGFYRSAKLRSVFRSPACSQPIQECQPMFEKAVTPRIRDTHLTDAAMFQSTHTGSNAHSNGKKLSQALLSAFRLLKAEQQTDIEIPETVFYRRYITHGGIRYSTRTVHQGNSSIFIPSTNFDHGIPAHIEHILETRDGHYFLAVSLHRPLAAWAVQEDPFRKYAVLGLEMWSSDIDLTQLHIIHPSVLEDSPHFANWNMPWMMGGEQLDVSVIMPLPRHYLPHSDSETLSAMEID